MSLTLRKCWVTWPGFECSHWLLISSPITLQSLPIHHAQRHTMETDHANRKHNAVVKTMFRFSQLTNDHWKKNKFDCAKKSPRLESFRAVLGSTLISQRYCTIWWKRFRGEVCWPSAARYMKTRCTVFHQNHRERTIFHSKSLITKHFVTFTSTTPFLSEELEVHTRNTTCPFLPLWQDETTRLH